MNDHVLAGSDTVLTCGWDVRGLYEGGAVFA